jgi:hypothetical protein
MNAITLDRVLTDAGHLPSDEREILEDLLRRAALKHGAWKPPPKPKMPPPPFVPAGSKPNRRKASSPVCHIYDKLEL